MAATQGRPYGFRFIYINDETTVTIGRPWGTPAPITTRRSSPNAAGAEPRPTI